MCKINWRHIDCTDPSFLHNTLNCNLNRLHKALTSDGTRYEGYHGRQCNDQLGQDLFPR